LETNAVTNPVPDRHADQRLTDHKNIVQRKHGEVFAFRLGTGEAGAVPDQRR
jgi:hypothetical protein